MGGSSGGGGGGDSVQTIRYAPYVEEYHTAFLEQSSTVYGDTTRIRDMSPYLDYEDRNYDDAFFGVGVGLSSFPTLYDTFTKYIFDLHFEDYFNIVFESVRDSANLTELSDAQRDLIATDVNQNALPRFSAGMRDINSVISSSFVVGKSIIEQGAVMQLASYNAEMKYKLLPAAIELYGKKLVWNHTVVSSYTELFKLMVDTQSIMIDNNTANAHNHAMWPFTVLAQERANIAALQGAVSQSTEQSGGPSKGSRVIGGVAGGAAMGFAMGAGLPGVVLGGVAGGLMSLF